MDREDVQAWVAAYEQVWRTPGTDRLAGLFTEDASYLMSPWEQPVQGLAAISGLWEAERVSADEEFTLSSEVVAVDGDVAVVRAEVEYAASGTSWRDLWVLRFATDGRCSSFEEWPFAPDQPDGH
jgi:ketosteroid isomerase-like protein